MTTDIDIDAIALRVAKDALHHAPDAAYYFTEAEYLRIIHTVVAELTKGQEPVQEAHWECRRCGYEGEEEKHKRSNPKWPGTEIECDGAKWVPALYAAPPLPPVGWVMVRKDQLEWVKDNYPNRYKAMLAVAPKPEDGE